MFKDIHELRKLAVDSKSMDIVRFLDEEFFVYDLRMLGAAAALMQMRYSSDESI